MSGRKRIPKLFIQDIVDAIEKIGIYTKAMTFEQFIADKMTKYAVVWELQVIGEAMKNVPGALKKKHPEIPWRAFIEMGDKLIIEYFEVNYVTVWKTLTDDLPPLKQGIERILKDLDKKA